MGNFSRKTFDRLKRYVGVRLQQGVPLVDADWNEQEDIRKYELRTFLKWFVGDGVPAGNDGFRILPAHDKLVLAAPCPTGRSCIEIAGEAVQALGLDDAPTAGTTRKNARRWAPPCAQLIGAVPGPYELANGMQLEISWNQPPSENEPTQSIVVDFLEADFGAIGSALPAEVAEVVNRQAGTTIAFVGGPDDFVIHAGICLVEGWETINESDLRFTDQGSLSDDLAGDLMAYLDVWEREVDDGDDPELIDDRIGTLTCVRQKREWQVRVAPSCPLPDPGHEHYELARFRRQEGTITDVVDRRATGLTLRSRNDLRQVYTDAYGGDYQLDGDGRPNLEVSLREGINAVLAGRLPGAPAEPLPTDAPQESLDHYPSAFQAADGDVWVFWDSDRNGLKDIWYKRYERTGGGWKKDQPLTAVQDFVDHGPLAFEDSVGDVWVFWKSSSGGRTSLWHNRYDRASGTWVHQTATQPRPEAAQLTSDLTGNIGFCAVEDSARDIWVFWGSTISGGGIGCKRHVRGGIGWVDASAGIDDAGARDPFAAAISHKFWLFWRSGNGNIRCHYRTGNKWNAHQEVTNESNDAAPFVVADSSNEPLVFWRRSWSVWCRAWAFGTWGPEIQVSPDQAFGPCAVQGARGDVWVFWSHDSDVYYKRYSDGSWGREVRVSGGPGYDFAPVAFMADNEIWIFWHSASSSEADIWYRRLATKI